MSWIIGVMESIAHRFIHAIFGVARDITGADDE